MPSCDVSLSERLSDWVLRLARGRMPGMAHELHPLSWRCSRICTLQEGMLPAPALVLLEGLTSAVSSLSVCFGVGYSFGALFGGCSSCFTFALVCSGADHMQWACACVSPRVFDCFIIVYVIPAAVGVYVNLKPRPAEMF